MAPTERHPQWHSSWPQSDIGKVTYVQKEPECYSIHPKMIMVSAEGGAKVQRGKDSLPVWCDDTRRRGANAPSGARGAAVGFTPRQMEVLRLAANGLASKQIARQLDISARTVDAHFTAMRERAAILSRSELIAFAVSARLIAVSLHGADRRKTRDETQEPISDSSRCPVCSRPLRRATTGRPRTYCSRACQARAYRARRNGARLQTYRKP